jgi:MoaA/NifB/PqqE/SkfB family radical SAM enzyme
MFDSKEILHWPLDLAAKLRRHPHPQHKSVKRGLAQLGKFERFLAVYRYARSYQRQGLLSLTFEVTKRCNAKCDFCDHWREPKQAEDLNFAEVVRRLDPLVVIFCGGEPLLRKDIEQIVTEVNTVPGWRYSVLITNGWLLTREIGLRLTRSGLHQINVSLNWPDGRQSEERKLKGLFERIAEVVPQLTAEGVEVNLNTMIMKENVDELPVIARLAARWGAKVTFTLYSASCNGNASHQFTEPADVERLRRAIEELIALKQQHKHITNSTYYLRQCIPYCQGQVIRDCPAGKKMIHLTPQGMVKPCADLPPLEHYSTFDLHAYPGVDCTACWMACRGEVQSPVDLERLREVIGV